MLKFISFPSTGVFDLNFPPLTLLRTRLQRQQQQQQQQQQKTTTPFVSFTGKDQIEL